MVLLILCGEDIDLGVSFMFLFEPIRKQLYIVQTNMIKTLILADAHTRLEKKDLLCILDLLVEAFVFADLTDYDVTFNFKEGSLVGDCVNLVSGV